MRYSIKIVLFIILFLLVSYLHASGFNLKLSASGGSGSWSNGKYEITYGATVTFRVDPSDGTANYAAYWDYGTIVEGTKPGNYNVDGVVVAYDTTTGITESNGGNLTETHTFDDMGLYEVWCYVTDSASGEEWGILMIQVGNGGTVKDPTTDFGGNNLNGDGVTDNVNKFEDGMVALGSGNWIIELPTGSYLFSERQDFNDATFTSVEFRPASGATVEFIFDPPEPVNPRTRDSQGPADAQWWKLFYFENQIAYIHNFTFTRSVNGTRDESERDVAIGADYGTGMYTIQYNTFTDWNRITQKMGDYIFERNNGNNWGLHGSGDGAGSNCWSQDGNYECMSSALGGDQDVMVKNSYFKAHDDGNSHWIYLLASSDTIVVFGNYSWVDNQKRADIIYYRNSGPWYHYRNMIDGEGTDSFNGNESRLQKVIDDPIVSNSEYIDNRFEGIKSGRIRPSSNNSVIWSSNKFFNTTPDRHQINIFAVPSNGKMTAENNTFGAGVPASGKEIWWFDTGSNCSPYNDTTTSDDNPAAA
jgi:hypothetical protein